jgi:signal transduction histidine kinase
MGKKLFLAWFFIILAVIAIYYQFSYQQTIRLDLSKVAQSLQVISLVYDLENQVAITESAVRGYLISENEQQLKQYHNATDEIHRLLTELTNAIQDEPRQLRWLKILRPLIKARLTIMDRIVELRQSQGFDAAQNHLVSRGEEQQVRIRSLMEEMEYEEKKRLNPQWASRIEKYRKWILASTIVVVMSLSVLLLISYLFGLELRRRKEGEEKLKIHQEGLRSMASQLSLAEEQERHRIGAHLHEHIGQSLALANIKLGELLATPDPGSGSWKVRLLEIRRLLEQTIHETQSLTFTVSSPILHEVGLEAALAWLTENSLRNAAIASFFESDDQPKPVSEEVAVLLYQVVAELLTNVIKHAQARHVKVSVWQEEGRLQVTVEDDGIGFHVGDLSSQWQEAKGYGLFSIRERLVPFGGSMTVDSNPGEGTEVIISVPLKTLT